VPKVKGLRVIFKKTDFTKVCPSLLAFWDLPASVRGRRGRRVSKINQAKKHSQQKAENPDRFLYPDLRKSRLQAGLDKYLVLGPFTILQCQTTPLTLGTLDRRIPQTVTP
jgi:hypothetical protein